MYSQFMMHGQKNIKFDKLSHLQDSWTLNIGPIVCPETSVNIYHYTLRNSPEECRFYLLRGGSLKSNGPPLVVKYLGRVPRSSRCSPCDSCNGHFRNWFKFFCGYFDFPPTERPPALHILLPSDALQLASLHRVSV